ncbi:class I SAM-dependent methyltransferase [Achromobacter sp. AGC39]
MATKNDISYHYDAGSDFFLEFLDRTHRAYSCAVWNGARSLEEAQSAKLARLAGYAGVKEGSRLLDIGCGWGGMMKYAVDFLGARRASGITLSQDQYDFVKSLNRDEIDPILTSWEDFVTEERFDSLVSVGAFEHFASLEDRFNDRHRSVYRKFFEWCRSVSTDDAQLGLQTIVTSRSPKTLDEIRDTRYLLKHVFPGSALPTVSDILAGCQDKYEITEFKKIGFDYARTLNEWKRRLTRNESQIKAKFGADIYIHYVRYFDAAERAFQNGIVSLVQLTMAPTLRPRGLQ